MNWETSSNSATATVSHLFQHHSHFIPDCPDPVPNHHGIVISVVPNGNGSIDNGSYLVQYHPPFPLTLYVLTEGIFVWSARSRKTVELASRFMRRIFSRVWGVLNVTSFGSSSRFMDEIIGSCVSEVDFRFPRKAVKTFDYSAQLRTPSPRQAAH